MFDIGFFELLVVGVIALTVLGPDQLLVAARTVGRYVGRARQQVSQISTQLQQHEMMQGVQDLRAAAEESADYVKQQKEAAEREIGNLQGSFDEHLSVGQKMPESLHDADFSEVEPVPRDAVTETTASATHTMAHDAEKNAEQGALDTQMTQNKMQESASKQVSQGA